MDFSKALEELKRGHRVARTAWIGTGAFLFLVNGSTFKVNRPPLLGHYEEGTVINYLPHIDIRTENGDISVWTPSQNDILSSDWNIFLK